MVNILQRKLSVEPIAVPVRIYVHSNIGGIKQIYTLSSTVGMYRLMDMHESLINLDEKDMFISCYLFRGEHISRYDTPTSLGLTNDDIIWVTHRDLRQINLPTRRYTKIPNRIPEIIKLHTIYLHCNRDYVTYIMPSIQMPLQRLMEKQKKFLNLEQQQRYITCFLYGDEHILEHDTPMSLGMKNEDVIKVYHRALEQFNLNFSDVRVLLASEKPLSINIHLNGFGQKYTYLIKTTDPMYILMQKHINTLTVSQRNMFMVYFLYNDKHVLSGDTPITLGLKDGHTIKIYYMNWKRYIESNVSILTQQMPYYIRVRFLSDLDKNAIYLLRTKDPVSHLMRKHKASLSSDQLNMYSIFYLFNGQYICESDTPISLGMKNDDGIEVYHRPSTEFNWKPDYIVSLYTALNGNNPDTIKIYLHSDIDENQAYFLKPTSLMLELMENHQLLLSSDQKEVYLCCFLFNDKRILENDTPITLGIKNGDLVRVVHMEWTQCDVSLN